MKIPTQKQLECLHFIHVYTQEHGYPPSIKDIGTALGVKAVASTTGHIERLIRKGLLSVNRGEYHRALNRIWLLTDIGKKYIRISDSTEYYLVEKVGNENATLRRMTP